MRKILGVCLLVLLLTAPAVAGEMPNGSPAPTPPTQESTTDGEMPNGVPDSLTRIALDLLAVLPSLL